MDLTGFRQTAGRKNPILVAIRHGVVWAILVVLLLFVVPEFRATYEDFGYELPVITQTLLRASYFYQAFPLSLSFVLLACVLIDAKIYTVLSHSGSGNIAKLWSAGIMCLQGGLIAAGAAALYLPYLQHLTEMK